MAGQDEDAIRQIIAEMEDAWNRHDMRAWSAAFAEDADFVNVLGTHRRGHAEIETLNVEQHRSTLKDTRQRFTDVRIRFLKPEVALVHRYWSMSSYVDAAGTPRPAHNGIAVHVMIKRGGKWEIAAFQNTIVRE